MAADLDPETLLHTVIEGIGQPFYALDAGWRFTLYNGEAERYFGRSAKDTIGKSLWDVYPGDVNHERGRVIRDAMSGRKLVLQMPNRERPGRRPRSRLGRWPVV